MTQKKTRTVPREYVTLIERMKFFIEPDISCSRFFGDACFTEESISTYRKTHDEKDLIPTEMGMFVASHLKGKLFIDIPCGLHTAREHDMDFDVHALAKALGAAKIWQVDIDEETMKHFIPATVPMIGRAYAFVDRSGPTATNESVTSFQDDMLGFISKMDDAQPKAIYISALQPEAAFIADEKNLNDVAIPYLHALYEELSRVCRKNDMVILNSSSMLTEGIDDGHPMIHPALALPPLGFTLMRRDARDKVHVFVKE